MADVTDPTVDPPRPAPPPIPGERRLRHPPSDRYRAAEPPSAARDAPASPVRGIALVIVAAAGGAAAMTTLGGLFAVSSGLLVVAGATGWGVAVALRSGAGAGVGAGRPVVLAIGLALLAVILGQLGLWLYARAEGGVLGPIDYLAEAFGVLVPLELVAAGLAAWVAAR
jgi:hypothetical protein